MLLASVVGALALFLFLALVLYVGVWASRETEDDDSPDHSSTHGERLQSHIPESRPRGNKTPNELLLYLLVANRSLPVALGIASMTATWVGAGYINGTAEAVFDLGLAWCQAPLGYAISLVIGDTVSIISELNPTVAMVAAVGVILFYTSLGGIVSVIYTDVVQICTTGLGIWSCMAFLTRSKVVGKVGAPHNDWLGRTKERDGSRMLDQFLMTILGGIPWQVQNITLNYDR
ncbi:hypothetical protein HPB48_023102 [Haemaphysalis longicornis]|uniref:Uncharacterized protein n=1 Tax=Haemaphysalis longicornis TaxID=44386 RepID=A0A9J6FZ65_HAELO|nr:hypothetical protein HPB48_023102 [Haemaphysalis longicornis]